MQRLMVGCLILLVFGMVVGRWAAEAQPTGKVYRIGCLGEGKWASEPAILEALRRLGYVEGHDLVVERRYATPGESLPALAAELVMRQVDLILTNGTQATQAAHQATTTIPIVFSLGSDPVRSGLIASYARPGGNLTGMVIGLYGELHLAMLKEALPGVVRVASLVRAHPEHPDWVSLADTARKLGLELLNMDVPGPEGFDDFFAAARRAGADAVIVPNLVWLGPHLQRLGALATQRGFPAIGYRRAFAEGGGLLSYGQQLEEIHVKLAAQVDKLLKGAHPADVPVEHPMRFELVINLKAAHALGLTIPPTLLLQADTVIR
jgi:putative ABC transport system substrate-binding protein